jgi:hypothetical protein
LAAAGPGGRADVAGRLDLLIEWVPHVAYVLSVTVLLL